MMRDVAEIPTGIDHLDAECLQSVLVDPMQCLRAEPGS